MDVILHTGICGCHFRIAHTFCLTAVWSLASLRRRGAKYVFRTACSFASVSVKAILNSTFSTRASSLASVEGLLAIARAGVFCSCLETIIYYFVGHE